MENTVGARVKSRLEALGLKQVEVAQTVGMREDMFSRSLNNDRQFKLRELASVANALNASVHWLITGERAPYEVKLSARHEFDYQSGQDKQHDWVQAGRIAGDVARLYQQVGLGSPPARGIVISTATPAVAAATVRDLLIAELADNEMSIAYDLPRFIEQALGVDVVVLDGEPSFDAYSAEAGGVRFIVSHTSGAWFRANWNIAHELGHIVHGDLAYSDEERQVRSDEAWANAFAAELLAPAEKIRSFDWEHGSAEDLACLLLGLGVSNEVLRIRVRKLGVNIRSAELRELVNRPTHEVCRGAGADGTRKLLQESYLKSRFPPRLLEAHWEGLREDRVSGQTLAWMLGTPVEDINPAWGQGHVAVSTSGAPEE